MTATYEKTIFGERRQFADQLKAVHDATAAKRCASSMPELDKKYRTFQAAAQALLDELSPGWDKTPT